MPLPRQGTGLIVEEKLDGIEVVGHGGRLLRPEIRLQLRPIVVRQTNAVSTEPGASQILRPLVENVLENDGPVAVADRRPYQLQRSGDLGMF